MSRALDKQVLASLQKQDPSAAYQAISEVLVSPSHSSPLEIEILGSIHGLPDGVYILQDGPAVGVSKLGLVMAFLVARKVLAGHLDATSRKSDDELLAATAVVLLMDPEYLTAANTRKRTVQRQLSKDQATQEQVFIKEKYFIDSLLTSRLHRHTKSPTLWSHRRWLLQTQASLHIPTSVLSDLTEVVFVAGERHPRNYYAWCHARFLMGLGNEKVNLDEVLEAVKIWCFKHHTDISGWTFLHHLLNMKGTGDPASSLVLTQVFALVESLRLPNESVWVFLRSLTAGRLLSDTDYDQFLTVNQDILENTVDETDKRVLERAVDWCKTYRLSSISEDSAETSVRNRLPTSSIGKKTMALDHRKINLSASSISKIGSPEAVGCWNLYTGPRRKHTTICLVRWRQSKTSPIAHRRPSRSNWNHFTILGQIWMLLWLLFSTLHDNSCLFLPPGMTTMVSG